MTMLRICTIPDCGKRTMARGLCSLHYAAAKRRNALPQGIRHPKGAGKKFADAAIRSDTDECILWPYLVDPKGYGRFRIKYTAVAAHRYVCAMAHGDGEGLVVRHACRTPRCINPRHLSFGTYRDNAQDTVTHGMSLRGERNWNCKLNEELVKAIRASQLPARLAAKFYGVHKCTINQIRARTRWKHVA